MPSFLKYTTIAAAVLAALSAGRVFAQSYVSAAGEPLRNGYGEYWRSEVPGAATKKPAPALVSYSAEVLFAFDDDALTPDARKRLDEIARKLLAVELDALIAVGHADEVGPPQYNKRLSARRAKAVGDYLAGKGLPVERLQLVAMGQEGPQPERRVHIELIGREKAD
jgi:outer membrane protein OmpA-like peptidoglycan-associated protein